MSSTFWRKPGQNAPRRLPNPLPMATWPPADHDSMRVWGLVRAITWERGYPKVRVECLAPDPLWTESSETVMATYNPESSFNNYSVDLSQLSVGCQVNCFLTSYKKTNGEKAYYANHLSVVKSGIPNPRMPK